MYCTYTVSHSATVCHALSTLLKIASIILFNKYIITQYTLLNMYLSIMIHALLP